MGLDALVLSGLAIACGIVVGLLRRGRLRNLAALPLRWPALVPVAVGIAVGAGHLHHAWAAIPVGLATGALLWSCLLNRHLPGLGVVALGLGCNLVVLGANGAFPVRAQALVDARLVGAGDLERVRLDGGRRLERPGDRLEVLGGIVPIPETRQVVSFGDLIVVVGLLAAAAGATSGRPAVRVRPQVDLRRVPLPRQVDAAARLDLQRFAKALQDGQRKLVQPGGLRDGHRDAPRASPALTRQGRRRRAR